MLHFGRALSHLAFRRRHSLHLVRVSDVRQCPSAGEQHVRHLPFRQRRSAPQPVAHVVVSPSITGGERCSGGVSDRIAVCLEVVAGKAEASRRAAGRVFSESCASPSSDPQFPSETPKLLQTTFPVSPRGSQTRITHVDLTCSAPLSTCSYPGGAPRPPQRVA